MAVIIGGVGTLTYVADSLAGLIVEGTIKGCFERR